MSSPRTRPGSQVAAKIERTAGYALIPPFDHRQVIAGQGTIGLEIADDCGQRPPVAVLVPISGGGLISGIAVAIKALMPDTKVIGVEPELAADARESCRTRHPGGVAVGGRRQHGGRCAAGRAGR